MNKTSPKKKEKNKHKRQGFSFSQRQQLYMVSIVDICNININTKYDKSEMSKCQISVLFKNVNWSTYAPPLLRTRFRYFCWKSNKRMISTDKCITRMISHTYCEATEFTFCGECVMVIRINHSDIRVHTWNMTQYFPLWKVSAEPLMNGLRYR